MSTSSQRTTPVAGPPGSPADRGRFPGAIPISATAYWLSGTLLLISIAAAGLTAFGRFLSGPAVMVGSARGTALVVLFVTTPVIAVAMVFAARGSARAVLVWLGALAALLYNAQMFLYATPFNSLFLLYVAMLGLSVWSIVWLLRGRMVAAVAARVDDWMPVRLIAAYVWLITGVNALIWLRAIVPALLSTDPTSVLAGTGLTTNPVFVQDLALWLPLAAAAGVWLWRRHPMGYLISGALLTLWVIESISVAVDQWFGDQGDPTSAVVSLSMVPAFAVMAVVGLVPLVVHLRHVAPGPRLRHRT